MTTSAEFEIVRQMKEQCCYVAFNPQKEEENKNLQKRQYQLPDGSMVEVSAYFIIIIIIICRL
jgi:centractin